ncbi:MAG: endolytic transglycosylase MltG [Oscillospiraceae bacterium]|nr:endolytic transglycosylase MltG [Oscillospiraceae bacterium]
MGAKNNNADNFDEILSSILDSSAQKSKEENREGVIADIPSYKDELEKYANTSIIDTELSKELADNDSLVSGNTNVFMFSKPEESMPSDEPVVTDRHNEVPSKPRAKKKKRRRANYSAYGGLVLATLVLCCAIIIALFGIVVGRDVLGIDTGEFEKYTIYIPEGSTTTDIANILYDEGIIYYTDVFRVFAKLKSADGNMYPGDIDVAVNMSYSDLIDSLMIPREAKETVTVTFPEGITLYAAALKLEESGICDAQEFIFEFNSSVFGYDFEKHVGSSSMKLYKYEGYLFPDTYEFYLGDSTHNIVRKIKQRTDEMISAEVIKRCSELGYTLDEMITLASIVQLESWNFEDMKTIASVFHNRLNNPEVFPKLQSDTTYSYINDVIKVVSSIESQEMYNAYDTYTCNGLPVGAICNPGMDAINAVLYPDETEYYYFCADLFTRETFFAATYEEHLDNLKKAGLSA